MESIRNSIEELQRQRLQRQQSGTLYHYTTKERAIENIFASGKIRMNSLATMNDPRERDPWFFGLSDDGAHPMTPAEVEHFSDCVFRIFKRSVRLLCLTADEEGPEGEALLGFGHDRMWAQYAGNHTGVCIAFNRKILRDRVFDTLYQGDNEITSKGAYVYGEVVYRRSYAPDDPENPFEHLSLAEMRRVGFYEYLRKHRYLTMKSLYLVKNPDWVSENEYRFVWLGDDDAYLPPDTPIEIPISDCATDVFLGTYFPEVYHDNIRAIERRTGIVAWTTGRHNGAFRLLPLTPG